MTVLLLHAAISPPPLPQTLHEAFRTLPERFREEAKRFVRQQDHYARLLGRWLLSQGLERLGHSPDLMGTFQRDVHGRPFLDAPVDFNISHSGPLVICAVTAKGRVGIDIEKIQPVDLYDFFSIFSSPEWDTIEKAPAPLDLFFRLWTKRESVLKAAGVGMTGSLAYLDEELRVAFSAGNRWHITELFVGQGYACSLATEHHAPHIVLEELCFDDNLIRATSLPVYNRQ